MVFMKLENNEGRADMAGFSLIEVLISLAILSVGLTAITAASISSIANSRTTARSDMSILWGQEVIEQMAAIPPDAPGMSVGSRIIVTENGRIEIDVIDPVDVNGNGQDDYKTIVTRVFVKRGGTEELRAENFLRRSVW